jgi:hypothetical protein
MNKQIFKKIIAHTTAFAVLALVLVAPMFVFAQATPAPAPTSSGGFIVCDGGAKDPCTFAKVMEFVKLVLNFVVYKLITPLCVIMLMWQGFKLIASAAGTKPASLTEIKASMLKILVGYIWVLAAWIIVKTVVVILAGETPKFDVFFN